MAAFEDTNEASIREVVCNYKGEVLAAMSGKISLPSLVVMVEVMAARRVVQFVVEIGSSHSIFEGDWDYLQGSYFGYCSSLNHWSSYKRH